MPSPFTSRIRESFGRLWAWSRVRYTLAASILWGLMLSIGWESSSGGLLARTIVIGLVLMLVFGFFERWPANPPRWLARWVLQVAGVAVSVPFVVMAIYVISTAPDQPPFYEDQSRMGGYGLLTGTGILLAPWVAMSALLRQRDSIVQSQAVAFERARTELERQALDARLRLLQAQVQPHFLFNTLANVRELVDSGSPQASAVLNSLIAYLRAAVPRLQDPATTMGQELQLVRAYLELMHMRMPDRLQFGIHADDAAHALRCPPMTLLTLVENAVRHGIDPGEEGGRIEVRVRVQDGRCRAQVIDTGVGLRNSGAGLGTGLTTLRERLELTFGGDARLRLVAQEPRGVRAEVDFPAQAVTA
ncbi:MAG: sensor histidine kinase [Steroidobacteraceae bacterium]